MTEWLGQNGEDRVIAAYLAEHHPGIVGRVLDIGAHDGWSLSNTARLLERGWGGTLVEPNPRALVDLIARWGTRSDIQILGFPITPDAAPEMVTWWEDQGAACHDGKAFLSTSRPANVDKWAKATTFRQTMALACPISWLQHLASHVVSIDTEGDSVDILRELDLTASGTLVVVCEHDDRIPEVVEHVEKHGLRVAVINAENVIAVRA